VERILVRAEIRRRFCGFLSECRCESLKYVFPYTRLNHLQKRKDTRFQVNEYFFF